MMGWNNIDDAITASRKIWKLFSFEDIDLQIRLEYEVSDEISNYLKLQSQVKNPNFLKQHHPCTTSSMQ